MQLATTYAEMIRKAFHEDWWSGEGTFDGYTQMESNFSLFWGLAIMAYETTLVSDEAPVDRFVGWAGTLPDASALRPAEIRGLELFRGKALCVSCHKGAEFTSAATGLEALSQVEKSKPDLILLDIMMPGMDGYEVCRRLRQLPETAEVPAKSTSMPVGPIFMVATRSIGLS